jgi:hypothetical protein
VAAHRRWTPRPKKKKKGSGRKERKKERDIIAVPMLFLDPRPSHGPPPSTRAIETVSLAASQAWVQPRLILVESESNGSNTALSHIVRQRREEMN